MRYERQINFNPRIIQVEYGDNYLLRAAFGYVLHSEGFDLKGRLPVMDGKIHKAGLQNHFNFINGLYIGFPEGQGFFRKTDANAFYAWSIYSRFHVESITTGAENMSFMEKAELAGSLFSSCQGE